MAITYLTPFSESRRASSDGSYTDQKVFRIASGTAPAVFGVLHDLHRQPDWVRVTQLAIDATPSAAYLCPVISETLDPDTDRFLWLDTLGGGDDLDPADGLFFAGTNAASGEYAYFLVEFGITHSVPK